LNAINVGCAGFNTVLGPVRPTFLALSAALQSFVWYSVATSTSSDAWKIALPSTAVVLVLSFLPEFLSFARKAKVGNDTVDDADSNLVLIVNGMGCTACATKVDAVLEAEPRVLGHQVVFEEKLAKLTVERGSEDGVVADLCERLTESGFPSELQLDSVDA
jgi:hypothetical protein